MELSLPHTLHLFNIFHENDGKENCAQLLEEECIKMPFLCPLTICYLAVFIYLDYKKIFVPSISHFYHHLFAELVHLYNLPLYWVCWGHKRFLVFGCRVVWERPSSSYTSHGLINLRSSTWGKFATVLQTSALGGPTWVYENKLCSRHQALFWRRSRGGECLKVYLLILSRIF